MAPYHNLDLLADERARDALHHIAHLCEALGLAMPAAEPAQADALIGIMDAAGGLVRNGSLRVGAIPDANAPAIRLYKAPAGIGRLKLQLFPLRADEAHPPHAHHNLISCQIVLTGRAEVREFSLLRRLDGRELEIREGPEKRLGPGDGVYTLQRRNNVHWQKGLTDGTVLLNINWQGYWADTPMPAAWSEHGRCFIDWSQARPTGRAGCYIVPEVQSGYLTEQP